MISVTDALISEMTDLRMSQTKVLEVLDIVYDARDETLLRFGVVMWRSGARASQVLYANAR